MVKTYKRWTEEEEQYLFSVIQKHQGNLSEAFDIASTKLGRTPKSCQGHWYLVMKNDKKYAFCFVTVGSKTTIVNGKNTSNTINVVQTKVSIFNKITKILKTLFK